MANILDKVIKSGAPLYDRSTRHAIRMNKIANRVAKRKIPLGYIERDGVLYAPGEYVEQKPHRDYIERWQALDGRDIAKIMRPDGYIRRGFDDVTFTSVPGMKHSFFDESNTPRGTLVKIKIPKEWHREHSVSNPQYGEAYKVDKSYPYADLSHDRKYYDYKNGGRVGTYDASIPQEFIDEVCIGRNAELCFDGDDVRNHIKNYGDGKEGSPNQYWYDIDWDWEDWHNNRN